MKKKNCLLLISLFIVQLFFSQQTYDVLVQYDMMVKSKGFKIATKNQFLLMNKKESIYFDYKEPDADYSKVYAEFNNKKNKYRIQHNANSNEFLFSTGGVVYYFFRDTPPEINWEIKSDKKEILGFNCQKAIGEFRGRKYTVWFTTDIPYSYGPWKLTGLPGVILEAEDSEKQNVYYATNVSLNKRFLLPKYMEEKLSIKQKILPYSVYVEKSDYVMKTGMKQAMASYPKGTKFITDEGSFRSLLQELTYEWEVKDKK